MKLPEHVEAHLRQWIAAGNQRPAILTALDRKQKDARPYNLLYRITDELWVHLTDDGTFARYTALEPLLDDRRARLVAQVREHAFERIAQQPLPADLAGFRADLEALLDDYFRTHPAAATDRAAASYHVRRQVVGAKDLEPVVRDPWIEDIHGLGTQPLVVIHKIFGACRTNIQFADHARLDAFLADLSERMGRPASEARPIVDGALADGSRINIIFGRMVGPAGSSFTIRKFSEVPLSVTQLIGWGTLDARIGAYLWLCMEQGCSVFVSGETASGKTTTLNALLPLVPAECKILTAEDTPEVRPPHSNWQQLVTRESQEASARVDMGDLLKVGLRSRPDRLIVGEIRGAEGAVAFQAMQTGYPTYATFHAASVTKLIQRLTSPPINVPPQFMPNLQVVLVQLAVHVGGRRLRRVIEVEEIEAYSRRLGSPVTRQVFRWDPVKDRHEFTGRNNSYVLETIVAPRLHLKDPRDIYKELERRTRILEELAAAGRFDYEHTMRTLRAQRGAP